jgi:hypothetical protein
MPLTMCQGLVIGLDKESRTPTLPTIGGIIKETTEECKDLTYTFVESENINDLNYISEGFLSRYSYKFDKEKTGSGKLALKIAGVVAVLAATAVVTVFTCGAGTAIAGAGLAAALGEGAALVGSAAGALLWSTVGTMAAGGVAGLIHWGVKASNRAKDVEPKTLYGKSTPIPEGYERKEEDDSR